MTIFKVYEYDGYFYYSIGTTNLSKAVRILWNMFGDTVKYDVL